VSSCDAVAARLSIYGLRVEWCHSRGMQARRRQTQGVQSRFQAYDHNSCSARAEPLQSCKESVGGPQSSPDALSVNLAALVTLHESALWQPGIAFCDLKSAAICYTGLAIPCMVNETRETNSYNINRSS
jgi:hypothetical protein